MNTNQLINAIRFNKFFWVILVLLFLMNILFYALFIKPQGDKMTALRSNYQSLRDRHPSAAATKVGIYRTKGDIGAFRDQLPFRNQFSDIVTEIVQILKKQSLPITKIIFEPEIVADINLLKYTSAFSLEGEYGQIKSFLADIQNSKTLFCIEGLSLSKIQGLDKKIAMKIKISTYLR